MKEAEDNGQFAYIPVQLNEGITDEEENFDDANETPIQLIAKV
jgi:hypothetical protein